MSIQKDMNTLWWIMTRKTHEEIEKIHQTPDYEFGVGTFMPDTGDFINRMGREGYIVIIEQDDINDLMSFKLKLTKLGKDSVLLYVSWRNL